MDLQRIERSNRLNKARAMRKNFSRPFQSQENIMTRLLLSLALLCGCAHAQMLAGVIGSSAAAPIVAPSVVQVKGCSGTSTPNTCSLTSNMTAGNTAVSVAVSQAGGCTSVTSTPSNTFQPWFIQTDGGNQRMAVFIARNVASATNTIVATCPGASSWVSQMIYEVSCSTGTAAGDVVGSTTGSGGTPTFTTVNAVGSSAEEVIGSIFDNNNFRTWVAGTGYTLQAEVNSSSGFLGATEDNNTKTGLSGTQSATITGVSTDGWVGSIIALACSPTQDGADTIVTFEGLTNASNPTVAQLNHSTFGVPVTWSIARCRNSVYRGYGIGTRLSHASPHRCDIVSEWADAWPCLQLNRRKHCVPSRNDFPYRD